MFVQSQNTDPSQQFLYLNGYSFDVKCQLVNKILLTSTAGLIDHLHSLIPWIFKHLVPQGLNVFNPVQSLPPIKTLPYYFQKGEGEYPISRKKIAHNLFQCSGKRCKT